MIADTKRNAAGISPEELSLQDAFMAGQREGLRGVSEGLNPYQDGTPEHAEWSRGRNAAEGMKLANLTRGKA